MDDTRRPGTLIASAIGVDSLVRERALPIKIKRLHPDARLPTRATEGSSGLDVYALTATPRPYGYDITTGIAVEMPEGWECQVRPRSGLTRLGYMAALGTVDSDFVSGIEVTLLRTHQSDLVVEPGMRVAQLVFQKVPRVELVEVDDITPTGRGGHGSTGL
jgi:dUTP pyrophosphatase